MEFYSNPRADSSLAYGERQAGVLNDEAFADAREVITSWPGYAPTPLLARPGLAGALGLDQLWYKDEAWRFGLKSFKPLGGAYAVARVLMREIAHRTGVTHIPFTHVLDGRYAGIANTVTVTAATDGNHGRSVAWGARLCGCRAVIFIHGTVSVERERSIAELGARVVRHPGTYDDAVREAGRRAAAEDWHVVPDTSDGVTVDAPRDVMQGYTVMADEALAQLERPPTHIFLQAGVGGMAAAVAAYFWRRLGSKRPVIILVEPDTAACWLRSIQAERPVVATGDLETVMAGLACGEVSHLAWEILPWCADAAMTVTDAAAMFCMRMLADGEHGDPPLVAGESAIAGLAGLIAAAENRGWRDAIRLDARSRVLVFGTEGATDPEAYERIVGRPAEQVAAGSEVMA